MHSSEANSAYRAGVAVPALITKLRTWWPEALEHALGQSSRPGAPNTAPLLS